MGNMLFVRQLRSRLFGCFFAALFLFAFALAATIGLLTAFCFLFAAGFLVAGGASLGGLDCLLPSLDGLAFGGLDVDYLLHGNVRNGDFAAFGLLLFAALFLLLFTALSLLLFAALFLLTALSFFLAAVGLCFTALCFLLAALLLFAFALAAALLLQSDNDLVAVNDFGANNLFAFDNESLGADALGIDGLGIFNNNGGNLIGTGDDGGNFLLSAATGSGDHCSANCANE